MKAMSLLGLARTVAITGALIACSGISQAWAHDRTAHSYISDIRYTSSDPLSAERVFGGSGTGYPNAYGADTTDGTDVIEFAHAQADGTDAVEYFSGGVTLTLTNNNTDSVFAVIACDCAVIGSEVNGPNGYSEADCNMANNGSYGEQEDYGSGYSHSSTGDYLTTCEPAIVYGDGGTYVSNGTLDAYVTYTGS